MNKPATPTRTARVVKVAAAPKARAKHASTTPGPTISNKSSRTAYDGAELRPFAGRAGAMDAYQLPSKGM